MILSSRSKPPGTSASTFKGQQAAMKFVQAHLGELDLPFQVPLAELLGTLWY